MLNIKNIYYYSYSLVIINIIKNKNILYFKKWKRFLKILIFLSKDNNINNYLVNKFSFFKEIIYVLKKKKLIDNIMINFLNIILKDSLFFYIKLIYKSFIKIYNLKNNIINVYIYSRNYINNKNLNLIKKFIKFKFKNNLNFIFIKSNNILAGFKIYINDFVIDYSLFNIFKKINFISYKEFKNVF